MNKRLFALSVALLASYSQLSYTGSLTTLPSRSEDGEVPSITGISGNGSVVIGIGTNEQGQSEAVRWSQNEGYLSLGSLDSNSVSFSKPYGVNEDGSVIVGESGDVNSYEAFRWTQDGGMVGLGHLGGTSYNSTASDVSADGSIVVGTNYSTNGSEGFRWTEAEGMIGLGSLDSSQGSYAFAVSADGLVVVGYSGRQAFRWTDEGGMTGLGGLGDPGEKPLSRAYATNSDGSVVVGISDGDIGLEAFRWTEDGGMVGLGHLPNNHETTATGVSADGSIVVGYAYEFSIEEINGFRWTQATGMQTITQWLTESGVDVDEDFEFGVVHGISDDGTIIVGDATTHDSSSNDHQHITVRYIARGNSGAISLADLQNSVADAGLSAITSLSSLGTALNGAHSRSLSYLVAPNNNCGWVSGDWGRDDHGSKKGRISLAEVGGCHHYGSVQINTALGKSWSKQQTSLNGRIKHKGSYVMAEALIPLKKFDQGELWTTLSAVYQRGNSSITRGYLNAGLPDSSQANPDSHAWGLRARLEWNSAVSFHTADLSPYIDLSYIKTKIDGYTETGGGFPATYNTSKEEATELRVGLNTKKAISDNTNLIGLAEMTHRFNNTGTIVSGAVTGISPFNYSFDHTEDSWLRAGIGVEHKTRSGKVSFVINGTTQGEAPTAWASATWQTAF